jgi:hypothetical protein
MSTLRQAAQQALEALEQFRDISDFTPASAVHAITALRAALAEPEQEPVASLMTNVQSGDVEVVWNDDGFDREMWHETPLYTAPTPRKPLTDEEIGKIAGDCLDPWSCARAIERAHGIKEQET